MAQVNLSSVKQPNVCIYLMYIIIIIIIIINGSKKDGVLYNHTIK